MKRSASFAADEGLGRILERTSGERVTRLPTDPPLQEAAYRFANIRAGLFDLLHVEPS